jgi:hypothetical protein
MSEVTCVISLVLSAFGLNMAATVAKRTLYRFITYQYKREF